MTRIGAERSDGGVVCVEAVWFRGEAVEVAELEQGTGRHWAKEILLRRRTSTSSPWVSPCYWPSRWCCTSGERGMELGLRDPGHLHAYLHRVVPGRVPDLHAAQARPFMRIAKVVAAAFR